MPIPHIGEACITEVTDRIMIGARYAALFGALTPAASAEAVT